MPPATSPTPELVTRGLWLLENAQDSRELSRLDKEILVELCNCKLEASDIDYEAASIPDLVTYLSHWVGALQ